MRNATHTGFGLVLSGSLLALAAGCAREQAPTPTDVTPATASIRDTGLADTTLRVRERQPITFVNEGSTQRQIVSDQCPELSTPTLQPGERHTVTPQEDRQRCDIGDALQPNVAAFQGTVIIEPAAERPETPR